MKLEITTDMKNELRKSLHDNIGDVSERFVDDVLKFFEKFNDVSDIAFLPLISVSSN